jgi:hypothetical protein
MLHVIPIKYYLTYIDDNHDYFTHIILLLKESGRLITHHIKIFHLLKIRYYLEFYQHDIRIISS